MRHSKDQIIKAYRKFCDDVWPKDDNCVDDPAPWCKECDFCEFCENYPFLDYMSDSVYEKMESILEDYGYLIYIFEDKYKQYLYDGYMNFKCGVCEECMLHDLCEKNAREYSDEDFEFLEKLLLLTGDIDAKQLEIFKPEKDVVSGEPSDAPIDNDGNSYEKVNAPAHYNGTDCIENMRKLYGDEAVKHFCICNAYKYRYRAGHKPGEECSTDLQKAKWYEDYAIKMADDSKTYY